MEKRGGEKKKRGSKASAARPETEPRYGFTEAELNALIAVYGRPDRDEMVDELDNLPSKAQSDFTSIFGEEVKDASLSTVIAPFFWPEGTHPDYGKVNTNMPYGNESLHSLMYIGLLQLQVTSEFLLLFMCFDAREIERKVEQGKVRYSI